MSVSTQREGGTKGRGWTPGPLTCALEIAQIRNRKLTAGEQAALDRARSAISRATATSEVEHG